MHTKTIAQKQPSEDERKIVDFHKYVINMRKKLCFEIGQLGNKDEVVIRLGSLNALVPNIRYTCHILRCSNCQMSGYRQLLLNGLIRLVSFKF